MDSNIVSEQQHLVITRQEAKDRGLNYYFTGKPCHKGHIAERYVVTANCTACVRKPKIAKDYKCSVEGCCSNRSAKGFCPKHYNMWKEYGDPLTKPKFVRGEGLSWLIDHIGYSGKECLIWPFGSTGKKFGKKGYGQTYYDGKRIPAHVLMCRFVHGEKPADNYVAAHSCGKGHYGCVAPNHLRWATPLENAQDRLVHGSEWFGELSHVAKLKNSDIREIRNLKGAMTQMEIAKIYGVSRNTITRIFSRQYWWYID